MFINKPIQWNLKKFLKGNNLKEKWRIGNLIHKIPSVGDWGIIFVTKDNRNLKELCGEKKLISGVYAFVKIISEVDENKYVEIEVIKNIIDNPISLEDLENNFFDVYDEIYRKKQASCREIKEETYKILRDLSNKNKDFTIAIEAAKGIKIKDVREVPQKKKSSLIK